MQEPYRHPDVDQLRLEQVLQALGDPVRRRILRQLVAGAEEYGWSDFPVGVAASTLSHHMKVLREAGLVTHRKEGTRCQVALRPELETRFPGLVETVLKQPE